MKCPKCKAEMKQGKALQNTWRRSQVPDFIGGGVDEIGTCSMDGPCIEIEALKCPECGYSVQKPAEPIEYKFNNGRGAVLCRACRVIIDENLSHAEAAERWAGRDLCVECKRKEGPK